MSFKGGWKAAIHLAFLTGLISSHLALRADPDGIQGAIEGLTASIELARQAVESGDSEAAREQVLAASRAVEGNLGALPLAIWEVRASDPDYQPPPLPAQLPPMLTVRFHESNMQSLRQSYADVMESLQQAEQYLATQQYFQSLLILKSAVDLFKSMYETSTDVKIYNLPKNLLSMQQEAEDNAVSLMNGFSEIRLASVQVKKIRKLKEYVIALFHAHRDQRATAQSILAEMNRLEAWYPKLLEAVDRARWMPPPAWLQQARFDAQPFVDALGGIRAGLEESTLPWLAAMEMAEKTNTQAGQAFHSIEQANDADRAEWARYEEDWDEWRSWLDERQIQLDAFSLKASEWGGAAQEFWNALAAISLGDAELDITPVGETSWWPANLMSRAPRRWPSNWVSDQVNELPSNAWLRRGTPDPRPASLAAGIDGLRAYVAHLREWTQGYAREARLAVASLSESDWQTAMGKASSVEAPYSISPWPGQEAEAIRDNLVQLREEAWAFDQSIRSALNELEALPALLASLDNAALACEAFVAEYPILLPREESLASATFELVQADGESASIRLIDHAALSSSWGDFVNELGLAVSLLYEETDAVWEEASELEGSLEEDLRFNQEIESNAEDLIRMGEDMDVFRSGYLGAGVPSYLFQALRFIDNDLKLLVLPRYQTGLERVPELEESLRAYVDYARSIGPQTLSRFVDTASAIRDWTDRLIGASYEIPAGFSQTIAESYSLPSGTGRLVFPENRDVVDRIVQARWSGSSAWRVPEMAASGLLTWDEIALGLPKIQSWLAGRSGGGATRSYRLTVDRPETFAPLPGGATSPLRLTIQDEEGIPCEGVLVVMPAVPEAGLQYDLSAVSDSAGRVLFNIGPFSLEAEEAVLRFSVNGSVLLTFPVNFDEDSDQDGLPDRWESRFGMNEQLDIEAEDDPDGDGLTTLQEYRNGTHPRFQDSDADGAGDSDELTAGSDPRDFQSVPVAASSVPRPPLPRLGWDWRVIGGWPDIRLTDILMATGDGRGAAMGYAFDMQPFGMHRTLTTDDFATWRLEEFETPPLLQIIYFQNRFLGLTADASWVLEEEGWRRLAGGFSWGTRNDFQCAVWRGRLYLIGGYRWTPGQPHEPALDGWTSVDGVEWERTFDRIDWLENRTGWVMGVWKDQLIAGGGRKADGQLHFGGDYYFDFYTLNEESGWEASHEAPRWPPVGLAGDLRVVGDTMFLMGQVPKGVLLGVASEVWTSADGADWTLVNSASGIPFDLPWVLGPGGLYAPHWHSGFAYPADADPLSAPAPAIDRSTRLATGYFHALALDGGGRLWGWGSNRNYGLGYEGDDPSPRPRLLDPHHRWKAVTAAQNASLAIREDGTLWGWGYGGYAMGTGVAGGEPYPTQAGSDADWETVSTSGYQTFAIKQDGTLWAWGGNERAALGQGWDFEAAFSAEPIQIGADSDWVHVQAGINCGAAIKADGSAWQWGLNFPSEWNAEPKRVQFVRDGIWKHFGYTRAVHLNEDFIAVLQDDGRLYLRGRNENGELGNGTTELNYDHRDPEPATAWIAATVNAAGSVAAIRYNNTLWTWGARSGGDWGEMDLEPRQVGSDADWIEAQGSGAYDYFIVRKKNGSLWAFGNGNDYVFGNGAESQRALEPAPIDVFDLYAPVDSDADRDGLPDEWEMNMTGGVELEPLGDADGDGVVNRAEWIAGSDPADAGSRLALKLDYGEGGIAEVAWRNADDRTDLLYLSTDLKRWRLVPLDADETSAVEERSVILMGNGNLFLRLERGRR